MGGININKCGSCGHIEEQHLQGTGCHECECPAYLYVTLSHFPPGEKACDHRFSVVVEWEYGYPQKDGSFKPWASKTASAKRATKLACEKCGETREL